MVISCSQKKKWIEVDPAFSKYIDAYTSGIISKASSVKIQLSADASISHPTGEVPAESLFEFSPAVKGKAFWLDARTIEFKPEKNLAENKLYQVSFKLGEITNVPSRFILLNKAKLTRSIFTSVCRSLDKRLVIFFTMIVCTNEVWIISQTKSNSASMLKIIFPVMVKNLFR
jgi:hypothetical protein